MKTVKASSQFIGQFKTGIPHKHQTWLDLQAVVNQGQTAKSLYVSRKIGLHLPLAKGKQDFIFPGQMQNLHRTSARQVQ